MLKQFSKFLLIGVSNTLINFLAYNGSLLLLRNIEIIARVDFLIAQIIGFILSVFWSFLLNRKFVFNTPEERAIPWYKALLKMYAAYAFTGIGLNSVLSLVWVNIFGIPKEFVSLLNDAVGLPVNFFLNKFWAFH